MLGIWGTSFIFIKIGLAFSPSFIFASLRQLVGAAAMLPFVLSKRESFPKSAKEFLPIIPLGIFNVTITNGSSFAALRVVPAGLATVIAYTQPIWVFVFAIFILKETMNTLKVLGTVLGFLGIATVFLPGVQISQAYFGGEALLILSSLSWGIGAIIFKLKVRTESLYMVNFLMLLFGGAPLLTVSLLTENIASIRWTPIFGIALFAVGVLSQAIGWTIWLFLIRKVGASKTSSSLFLIPIVTLAVGAVFLHETLSGLELIGASAVLAGTYFVSKSE